MARKRTNAASAQAWSLAGRQQGLITRRQLLELGYTKSAVEHRLTRGRLISVAHGVYAVGWAGMTRRRRWMAAVLACGDGAVLSHRSAGALWGILSRHERLSERPVEVSVSRRAHSRGATGRSREPATFKIKVRSRPALGAEDRMSHDGIPVTTPTRTLLDLATELTPRALERAVNEADKRDLVSPPSLRAALAHYRGRPGVRALRSLLDPETFRLSDSELEVLFRPIAVRVGLPRPLTKQLVNGFEVDFFWPALGLVVETDGLRYHRTPSQQARDRLRDQTHTASGCTALRFTHWQVKHEPKQVEEVLRRTAGHLADDS